MAIHKRIQILNNHFLSCNFIYFVILEIIKGAQPQCFQKKDDFGCKREGVEIMKGEQHKKMLQRGHLKE